MAAGPSVALLPPWPKRVRATMHSGEHGVQRSSRWSISTDYCWLLLPDKALLQDDLHLREVQGHRIGPEEIVAHHYCKLKAECVLPREWPVKKPRHVLLLQFSKRKPVYDVGHG